LFRGRGPARLRLGLGVSCRSTREVDTPRSEPRIDSEAPTRKRLEEDADPPYLYPDYVATRLRAPARPLVWLPPSMTEISGPVFGAERVRPGDGDLTRQHDGEPIGERIVVHGQVRDSDGRPVPHTLLEVWQANAAGRYRHDEDQHPAPLDPNFTGLGRCLTDELGRYRIVSVKPGAYPWRNHANAWRPAHIHFSLFGEAFSQRLVTQMYFPGDPLFAQDPILNSIPDPRGRERLISILDPLETVPEWALAYRFDIVLRGREATPFEPVDHDG
jgi:protocatechuate 3,4-dioxygenase, beta subunit